MEDGGAGGEDSLSCLPSPLSHKTGQLKKINRWGDESSRQSSVVATTDRPARDRISLVIVALVELATNGFAYEQSPERRELLADSICQSLVHMEVLSPCYTLRELAGLRAAFLQPFMKMVSGHRAALPGQALPALLGPDHALAGAALCHALAWSYTSRYRQEFIEGELLGYGGFGSVYRATNRLDKQAYAVKKVHVLLSSHTLLLKVLREATLLARLHHPNIVSYRTAWTEPCPAGGARGEVEGSSGSDSLEDWEEGRGANIDWEEGHGATIQELFGSSPDWSSDLKRVVGRPEGPPAPGRFWREPSSFSLSQDDEWEPSGGVVFSAEAASGRAVVAGPRPLPAPHSCLLYIQMELCDSTLRHWLDKRNTTECVVDPCHGFLVFRQLLLATEFLHGQSVVHRDIKPRNVFINSRLEVKLGDFGLAKELVQSTAPDTPAAEVRAATLHPLGPGCAGDTSGVGTTAYAAPEQLAPGGRADARSDMYSLGVVLWELHTVTATDMERAEGIRRLRVGGQGAAPGAEAARPGLEELLLRLTSCAPEGRPGAGDLLRGAFSRAQLGRLEGEAERKALRGQVELQARQLAAQEELLREQERELAVLRGLLARRWPQPE